MSTRGASQSSVIQSTVAWLASSTMTTSNWCGAAWRVSLMSSSVIIHAGTAAWACCMASAASWS
jgi:hypothetical protein